MFILVQICSNRGRHCQGQAACPMSVAAGMRGTTKGKRDLHLASPPPGPSPAPGTARGDRIGRAGCGVRPEARPRAPARTLSAPSNEMLPEVSTETMPGAPGGPKVTGGGPVPGMGLRPPPGGVGPFPQKIGPNFSQNPSGKIPSAAGSVILLVKTGTGRVLWEMLWARKMGRRASPAGLVGHRPWQNWSGRPVWRVRNRRVGRPLGCPNQILPETPGRTTLPGTSSSPWARAIGPEALPPPSVRAASQGCGTRAAKRFAPSKMTAAGFSDLPSTPVVRPALPQHVPPAC